MRRTGARVCTIAVLVVLVVLGLATSACSSSSTPQPASSSASSTASGKAHDGHGRGLPAVPGIVKEIEPSVVTIRTPIGLGSGVVYAKNGTIVTDAHVVESKQHQPFETVRVQFADGQKSSAKVLAVDDVSDVAVIKADRSHLPVPTYSSTQPQVGQMAVVVGSPLGLTETVTAGIVSGLHRNMPPSQEAPQGSIDLIQVDAPISPGNSGGAVVDGHARVIGLSEAYLPPSSGAVAIGFVTPATTVTDVADQLLAHGKATHAFLGVRPADITPQVAERFQLPRTSGVLVVEVTPGSPADKAGLQAGDIITALDSSKITDVTDLLAALRKKEPDQQVELTVQRGESQKNLTATLATRPSTTG